MKLYSNRPISTSGSPATGDFIVHNELIFIEQVSGLESLIERGKDGGFVLEETYKNDDGSFDVVRIDVILYKGDVLYLFKSVSTYRVSDPSPTVL